MELKNGMRLRLDGWSDGEFYVVLTVGKEKFFWRDQDGKEGASLIDHLYPWFPYEEKPKPRVWKAALRNGVFELCEGAKLAGLNDKVIYLRPTAEGFEEVL